MNKIKNSLLFVMLHEYWEWSNNDNCEEATVLFLRSLGISDYDIEHKWLNLSTPIKKMKFEDVLQDISENQKYVIDLDEEG